MAITKIEWTATVRKDGTKSQGYTANLWSGCSKVHTGCDFCYAEALSHRWGNDVWGNDKPRKATKGVWNDLARFQKLAKAANEMHRVFVGSMMDIFEKPMPLIDSKGNKMDINTGDLRDKFFNEVVPNSPNLMFLLLTKRPSNINKYIPESWKTNPPVNVMFGTSPVNQETADKLIPQLLEVNGKKFLSIEPQLGGIILAPQWIDHARYFDLVGGTINWIINGGESGHHKRPFNPDWGRHLRDTCKASNVPFFFKQIDKIQKIPSDLEIQEFPIFN